MTKHLTLIGKNILPLMEMIHGSEYISCNSIIIFKDANKIKSTDCSEREYLKAFRNEVNTLKLTDKEVSRFMNLWLVSEDVETTFQSILHKLSKD